MEKFLQREQTIIKASCLSSVIVRVSVVLERTVGDSN